MQSSSNRDRRHFSKSYLTYTGFQALGCILWVDWHSSGLTTMVTAAFEEGLKSIECELSLFINGGKGATSRKTSQHIKECADMMSIDLSPLIYARHMSAKIYSTAVQDGYQLYHHVFVFTLS